MKFLITSDLHIDINTDTYHKFNFYNDIKDEILIIAGDICGSAYKEYKYLQEINNKNIKTIVVPGNHLGYDYAYDKFNCSSYTDTITSGTKQTSISFLKNMFKNTNIMYLDNDLINVNDINIFGGCLYSNFLLYGNTKRIMCENIARRWLNDFRYVQIQDKDEITNITPQYYIKQFSLFKRRLNKCLKQTTGDFIVISHFAPSKKSISQKYLDLGEPRIGRPGFPLNACFASNLEKFIKDNPRIKYWIHGHVHECFNYYINQCNVICNPYGYKHETTLSVEDYKPILLKI